MRALHSPLRGLSTNGGVDVKNFFRESHGAEPWTLVSLRLFNAFRRRIKLETKACCSVLHKANSRS
jgi:hypothetical protein